MRYVRHVRCPDGVAKWVGAGGCGVACGAGRAARGWDRPGNACVGPGRPLRQQCLSQLPAPCSLTSTMRSRVQGTGTGWGAPGTMGMGSGSGSRAPVGGGGGGGGATLRCCCCFSNRPASASSLQGGAHTHCWKAAALPAKRPRHSCPQLSRHQPTRRPFLPQPGWRGAGPPCPCSRAPHSSLFEQVGCIGLPLLGPWSCRP